jgi:large subunit ribosomal protein L31
MKSRSSRSGILDEVGTEINMKTNLHPQYYNDAKVHCACGNTWTTGSTLPEINVNVCSKCHPFYTGQEKIVDTRGRVDKFRKRAAAAKAPAPKKVRASKSK